jgi:hypothetical protein
VALVLLMAACLTWPLAVAAFFMTAKWGLAGGPDDSLPDLTNVELILVTGTWAALGLLLWWWTRTSAFALLWGLSALSLATAIFLWSGMKHWDPDTVAAWYLVPGAALFGVAMALDLKWRQVYFAAPLYVMGLLVLLAALTYLAKEGPTTKWLGVDSIAQQLGIEAVDRGHQVKYSFILNGAAYLVLGLVADRSQASWWLRKTATLLFWLAPSHLLVPLRLLADQWALLPGGWTVPEVLLPVGALAFVFASVPKQMKSFFFSGLAYVAVAVQRLTAQHFEDVYAWPLGRRCSTGRPPGPASPRPVLVIGVEDLLAFLHPGLLLEPPGEARAVPGVAGGAADLLDLQQEDVLVAIGADLADLLDVAALLALAPQAPPAARPVVRQARLQRQPQGIGVHPGDHEDLARVGVLGNGRHEAARVDLQRLE